jgi:hypothetical protein
MTVFSNLTIDDFQPAVANAAQGLYLCAAEVDGTWKAAISCRTETDWRASVSAPWAEFQQDTVSDSLHTQINYLHAMWSVRPVPHLPDRTSRSTEATHMLRLGHPFVSNWDLLRWIRDGSLDAYPPAPRYGTPERIAGATPGLYRIVIPSRGVDGVCVVVREYKRNGPQTYCVMVSGGTGAGLPPGVVLSLSFFRRERHAFLEPVTVDVA